MWSDASTRLLSGILAASRSTNYFIMSPPEQEEFPRKRKKKARALCQLLLSPYFPSDALRIPTTIRVLLSRASSSFEFRYLASHCAETLREMLPLFDPCGDSRGRRRTRLTRRWEEADQFHKLESNDRGKVTIERLWIWTGNVWKYKNVQNARNIRNIWSKRTSTGDETKSHLDSIFFQLRLQKYCCERSRTKVLYVFLPLRLYRTKWSTGEFYCPITIFRATARSSQDLTPRQGPKCVSNAVLRCFGAPLFILSRLLCTALSLNKCHWIVILVADDAEWDIEGGSFLSFVWCCRGKQCDLRTNRSPRMKDASIPGADLSFAVLSMGLLA